MEKQRITVAAGDGIGPELLRAVLHVFDGAGVPLEYDEVEVGEKVYLNGINTGIPMVICGDQRSSAISVTPVLRFSIASSSID